MSRLNDTSALVYRPMRNGGSMTTSVRKIDNGYITSNSSYNDKTGEYKCSEEYTRDVPGAEKSEARSGVGCETLADAKKYLGSDV